MDAIELGKEVEVQLDVFSGRPNPHWTLTAERAEEVGQLLRDLEPAERAEPPGLGYRGFLLTSAEAKASVFGGVVGITRGDDTAHFKDVHGLEQHLLRQARDHGYGELLTAFGAPKESAREG
jgi:hypothetical protein